MKTSFNSLEFVRVLLVIMDEPLVVFAFGVKIWPRATKTANKLLNSNAGTVRLEQPSLLGLYSI
jgi:hypothetical protein